MKKILFVSNTANFQKFNQPFMKQSKEEGWQVDYASPSDEVLIGCDHFFDIEMPRNPLNIFKVLKAIQKLKIIIENNMYDVIHCHTPVGSVVARMAAKRQQKQGKIKIIYTAHGFHFYKGAPLLNWIIFYPVEKYLSRFTDVLILINNEDYHIALNKKFKAKQIVKLDGVGVDLNKFSYEKSKKNELRKRFGYSPSDFIILYIAEFIPRKNHEFLLNAITEIREKIPNLKLLLPGKGILLEKIKKQAKTLGLNDIINFIGYSKEINNLCNISDLYVTTSHQEGLPISVIEAMACGLPIIASNIRGQNDVIIDGRNGYLYEQNNVKQFCDYILEISNNHFLKDEMTNNNLNDVRKYSLDIALNKMNKIYSEVENKYINGKQ